MLTKPSRAKTVAVSDRNLQTTPEELRQRYDLGGDRNLAYLDSLTDEIDIALNLKVNTSSIVDNLTSTSATVPLSANQGKILNDAKANLAGPTFTGTVTLPSTTSIGNVSSTEIGYLDSVTSAIQTQLNAKIATSSIVNNLTSGGTTVPLSAEQGKELKTLVDARVTTASIVNNLTSGGTTVPLSAEQGKELKGITDNLTGTLLYNDATGSATSVTLSSSAANFDYLEIFYDITTSNYGCGSVKLFTPDGKIARMILTIYAGGYMYMASARATISGTNITISEDTRTRWATTPGITITDDVNIIHIKRVVGYNII